MAETSVVREVYDSAIVSGDGGWGKRDGRKSLNDEHERFALLCLLKFGSDSSDGLFQSLVVSPQFSGYRTWV